MSGKNVLAVLLAAVETVPLWAAPQAAQDPVRTAVETLKIVPLQGNRAINSTLSRTATSPVVEVRDLNDRPVENAEVLFELPASGPGGVFVDNQLAHKTRSNAQGQASVPGYWPNEQVGPFRIKVTAIVGGQTGTFYLTQANSNRLVMPTVETPRSSRRKWLILSGIGAAAAVAIILLTTGNGQSSTGSTPTIILSPGPVTIGGPR